METGLILLVAVAATAVVLSVGMLFRDLRRRDPRLERRLGLESVGLPSTSTAVLLDQSSGSWLDRRFYQLVEGSGTSLDGQTALALVAGLAVVGCAVPLALTENLLAAGCGTVLLPVIPLLWWSFRRYRRFSAIQKGLPETLELVADGIRAGQTLEQAAEMVGNQAPTPLDEEFRCCAQQLKLGHAPLSVLRRMARRVPMPEFKIFATAVLVHRQTGGNLALLAERLARSARDRGEFSGHVRAVTSGSRLSVIGLTLGTFAAVAILMSLKSDYLTDFVNHRLGPTLIVAAVILQCIGFLWVWRVLRVRY
jgi:tight adherence protein B